MATLRRVFLKMLLMSVLAGLLQRCDLEESRDNWPTTGAYEVVDETAAESLEVEIMLEVIDVPMIEDVHNDHDP